MRNKPKFKDTWMDHGIKVLAGIAIAANVAQVMPFPSPVSNQPLTHPTTK